MSTTPVSKAKPATRSVPRTATAKTQTKAPAAKAPSRAPKASATPPRPAAKPAPGPAHELPYLRFHHSQALRQKTHTVLNALEAASSHRGHGEALADLVAELVVAGMDWYFLRPLQRAQVGFVAEQSAKLGLSGATKMINSASRGFILRMDHQQLRVVAAYIRELS
jgi:hypothetical protein